ncbi:MAG: DUF4382 domain-containing protein [Phaeodactylibacter sp.]|nr:DUF4382 domain-containing protein [Phaeodactylibacter sp.]
MNSLKWFSGSAVLALFFAIAFVQCTPDAQDDDVQTSGKLNLEITDAPVDDPAVKGAFVTIAEVKVDGQSLEGFEGKQTIDLMAYQNGAVKGLGLADLEAGSYSNITLVLDYDSDANGNAPGCYILDDSGQKRDLRASSSSSNEITIDTAPFDVQTNQQTNVVIDFDLRKTIAYDEDAAETDYKFATNAEMRAGIRSVDKKKAGRAQGNCSTPFLFSDQVIVYAYKKGTFNRAQETSVQGTSKIRFKNAVTSAKVKADGSFDMSYMEEGEYELYFFGYSDIDSNGTLDLLGSLSLDLLGTIDFQAININAAATTNLNISITGLLP